ncbi:enoyl-CoA hydratase/isomerase family protein [Seongchinamella sediminis]|uniref:Enoyl-CoA hydratase/isomerase family protein n=1 Tax=Seongchinamella sediminis TaxID=2283635 RepID=A0A3L7DU27_9GAMM|nr:enoyl-CoA hydratase/isomerase family protein [Seongchinamella sediminis]RLQ21078.1 enoyl-CoA hydratase/isomerase family protein [Seongchinamella sediminis]
MDTSLETLSAAQLARLRQQPECAAQYSPVTGHPLLLLDLSPGGPCAEDQHPELARILRKASCPVIAIAPSQMQTALTESVDVVVESPQEAQVLIRNIRRQPLSAMTLVQLLRHNEHASLEDGLLAESLAYATLQGGSEFRDYLATRSEPSVPPTNEQPAVLAERETDHLLLTLNRPEQLNPYSIAMRDALCEGLQLALQDHSISRVIIRGEGNCFCTGGALEEFGLADDLSEAHAIRCSRHAGRLIAAMAERVECHLHRACIGSGIEIPAFAGHVVARHDTYFFLPEITMGLIPGAGGTVSILRRIGRQRLSYLALSARRIKAQTALQWGLVDAIA